MRKRFVRINHPSLKLWMARRFGDECFIVAGVRLGFEDLGMVCYPFRCGRVFLVVACLFVFSWIVGTGAQELPLSESLHLEDPAQMRLVWLRSEIARHDDLYYKKATPEISDFAYDKLKRELVELERLFPDVIAVEEIGDDRSGRFPKYRHGVPMLSLEKAYSNSELIDFQDRVSKATGMEVPVYLVEPKIDGIAISVIYENGKFVRAVTRGNGIEGDDISENILTIPSVPRVLSDELVVVPGFVELRGEVYVSFDAFREINRQRELAGDSPFASPRNFAAGSVKLKDSDEVALRSLSIVFFGYGSYEPETVVPATQQDFYENAKAWGLPILDSVRVVRGLDELVGAIKLLETERYQYPFSSDGAVVKVDSLVMQQSLGASSFAPRWALAYKFATERVETVLLEITIQVGRTGLLTPVAELNPVVISGSRVARASLYNYASIVEKDLRIGDTVYLEKAGEVIPTIVGVNQAKRDSSSQPFEFPSACPSCGVNLGEQAIRCVNFNCPIRLQRRLEHFSSSQCVHIRGLGRAMIKKLVERGWVNEISDIYRLERSDLLSLGSNVEVSMGKLLLAIERSKHAELWRFISGLGIPHVGKVRAKALANVFGSLEVLSAATASDFEEGGRGYAARVGSVAQAEILEYFAQATHRELVAELLESGVSPSSR